MEAIKQNRQSQESKHFTSLQIFTSYAEPALDEYLARKEQQVLEQKQRDEEDKLYRKFLERRREEEDNITQMAEEERDVYLNQLTGEERSKNIKLTEKHCRQMMDLIYKKKMLYIDIKKLGFYLFFHFYSPSGNFEGKCCILS